jgi:hypothetical protein
MVQKWDVRHMTCYTDMYNVLTWQGTLNRTLCVCASGGQHAAGQLFELCCAAVGDTVCVCMVLQPLLA